MHCRNKLSNHSLFVVYNHLLFVNCDCNVLFYRNEKYFIKNGIFFLSV